MPPLKIELGEIESFVGKELGVSEWHTIEQPEVNAFADATHDHQWIHIDVERAKRETLFGGTIAHGYYTLSLAPFFIEQIWSVEGARMALNYGLNKVRFPTPVPVGGRVRARATLKSAERIDGGWQLGVNLVFELDGAEKPACAAEALYRFYE